MTGLAGAMDFRLITGGWKGTQECQKPPSPKAGQARAMPTSLQEQTGSASPAWTLPPAQGHPGALPHTCAKTSTAVTLPAVYAVSEARAAPVGALSSTGGA